MFRVSNSDLQNKNQFLGTVTFVQNIDETVLSITIQDQYLKSLGI